MEEDEVGTLMLSLLRNSTRYKRCKFRMECMGKSLSDFHHYSDGSLWLCSFLLYGFEGTPLSFAETTICFAESRSIS